MEQGADDAAGSFARGVVNRSATCGDVASRLQSDFFFGMPVVHREGPYMFSFYSDEGNEPPHIHVRRDRNRAKFWLEPVTISKNAGFNQTELNRIARIIESNGATMLEKWNEHLNR